MGFIASYKHLAKLCEEMLNNEKGVSAYIDEMKNIPNGSHYVKGWDEDLKELKHYRWVRNKISHDPECTEQNMCKPEDEVWVNNFYSRIMAQTDPLALYRKAIRPRTKNVPTISNSNNCYGNPPQKKEEYVTILVFALILFLIVFLIISGL